MKISINDLSLIPSSGNRQQAMLNSVDLAVRAEDWGYNRIWFGEHHANVLFNSCAPEILISIVATQTSRIRLGAGSVLLNYHNPFRIAENYLLLAELFPERIDLGLGRNLSGTVLDKAFNGVIPENPDASIKIKELMQWMENDFPADNTFSQLPLFNENIPETWLSGSSSGSAKLAAALSLPYVFADFFTPALTSKALEAYFNNFSARKSRSRLESPKAMVCFRVICSESIETIRSLIAPLLIMTEQIQQGVFSHVLSPKEAIEKLGYLPQIEKARQENELIANMIVGTPAQVEGEIRKRISSFELDEIMIQDLIVDHESRLRSYQLISTRFTR